MNDIQRYRLMKSISIHRLVEIHLPHLQFKFKNPNRTKRTTSNEMFICMRLGQPQPISRMSIGTSIF